MYNRYDSDKVIIMACDELGEEFHVMEYVIPFPQGELCNAELEAIINTYINRASAELNEEISRPWAETSYKTKEDIEREQEEEDAELERIMEECDCDEEEAWDIYRREQADAMWDW